MIGIVICRGRVGWRVPAAKLDLPLDFPVVEDRIRPVNRVLPCRLPVCSMIGSSEQTVSLSPGDDIQTARDVRRGVLYLLFMLSGLAGLIYQVMWMRTFGLVFGSTTQAASAVLASFFGGLALGSFLGARLANRRRAALRRYGIAEIGIVAGALLVDVWVDVFNTVYPTLYQSGLGTGWTLTISKLLLASVAMAPPCVAMGMTLPLITRVLVALTGHFGRRVGVAYALNTLGATAGVLLAGFVLPPWIGTRNAVYLAMAINLAVGVTAIVLSLRAPSHAEEGAADACDARLERRKPSDPGLLFVVAVSGFGTLALEVLYTRLIVNLTDSSVFSFALMLAVFLVCLALASLIVSASVDRLGNPWRFLAWTQTLALVAILLSPAVFQFLCRLMPGSLPQETMIGYLLRLLIRAVVVVGPAVLLIGVVLPTAWKIATRSVAESGRTVGRLTSLNTLAAVVGSVVAGFVIVPLVGIGKGIALIGALYGALAMVSWWRGYQGKAALAGCAMIVTAFVGLCLLRTWHASPLRMTVRHKLVHYREGESATVAVIETAKGIRILKVNNRYTLGSSSALATRFQRAQGGLPLLLHRQPRSVAFIGIATGISVSSVLEFPVERVVAMELLPEVVEATVLFEAANRYVLRDERVQTLVADGRNHLFATGEQFDVVVGDLFVPWEAGTGYLYTTEHFEDVAGRLKENGIFTQWLPSHQLSVRGLRMIVGTFLDVFPSATLWLNRPGGRAPPAIGLVACTTARPGPSQADRELVTSSTAFPGLEYVCDAGVLRQWTSDVPRNSDEFPRVEFNAAASRYQSEENQRRIEHALANLACHK